MPWAMTHDLPTQNSDMTPPGTLPPPATAGGVTTAGAATTASGAATAGGAAASPAGSGDMAALYALDLPGASDESGAAPVPDWIMLLPPGPQIKGRDARTFRLSDPQGVITRFQARRKDLPLDWEHQSFSTLFTNERVETAGWIDALELRAGAIFGHVKWNARGHADIASRTYRYVSPVVLHNGPNAEIFGIEAAGLVHQPFLYMPALARRQDTLLCDTTERTQMMSTAPADEARDAARTAQAGHAPPDEKGAPGAAREALAYEAPAYEAPVTMRTAYAALQSENAALKSGLAELTAKFDALQAQTHAEKVEAALGAAIAGGRITPASRDYFAQNCQTPEGLAAFQAYVQGQPAMLSTEMAHYAQGTPDAPDARDLARRAAALQAERQAQGIQATLTECVAELKATTASGATTTGAATTASGATTAGDAIPAGAANARKGAA